MRITFLFRDSQLTVHAPCVPAQHDYVDLDPLMPFQGQVKEVRWVPDMTTPEPSLQAEVFLMTHIVPRRVKPKA